MNKKTHIILHHTGAEEKDAQQVKAYHLKKGWRDVGYNYIIERSGKLVEGRPLNIPGAHTSASGMNLKGIGIALIGNFEIHGPNQEQLDTLVSLLRNLKDEYDIPKENILPHKNVPGAKTLCPGKYFPYQEVMELLSEKNKYWRVQLGAFTSELRARDYANALKKKGLEVYVVYR